MDGQGQSTVRNEILLRHDEGAVAWLTLNRPDSRNALSSALMTALADALREVEADPAIRVVVIGGAGPAFCAGHDLREARALGTDPCGAQALFEQCSALMLQIVNLGKPVIARVHGIATAAGCQLVATCDLAVASTEARFATPGVNIGLFCSTPMVALSRAVPRKAALEMLLTGDAVDADHAVTIGLVNQVVPADTLDDAVRTLAERVARASPLTLAMGKRAFQRQADLPLPAAYEAMSTVMAKNLQAEDAAEGIGAFIERRAPVWTGR